LRFIIMRPKLQITGRLFDPGYDKVLYVQLNIPGRDLPKRLHGRTRASRPQGCNSSFGAVSGNRALVAGRRFSAG
jgi:hypothetical protein